MPILTQYSIVYQAPGAGPYTICAYNGTDLSQVLGITQANLPEGHHGWIQECGEALVKVSGQTQPAYATLERLSQLPPLLMEAGPYCGLIREARDVFVDGHFYACVAMCGISFERFQRDKAAPYGITRKHTMKQVRSILRKNKILLPETLDLCKKMADLRNDYAHGNGLKPKEDALKALAWVHSFINKETNLMRDYVIVDGVLHRKHAAQGGKRR